MKQIVLPVKKTELKSDESLIQIELKYLEEAEKKKLADEQEKVKI